MGIYKRAEFGYDAPIFEQDPSDLTNGATVEETCFDVD